MKRKSAGLPARTDPSGPPVGTEPPWDAARLGLVLAWMPGGGRVEVGVRSPYPGLPERQTAIVRGVAMPTGRARC